MVSKFHHERESIFLSFSVLYPLENPIDQTGLVSCRSVITNKMGDVIHLEEWFGFELQKKGFFFLPFHLAVLSITLLPCCRNVIYDNVTGKADSAWKEATVT